MEKNNKKEIKNKKASKNNKGFTLIEIIGVVIILGLILVIGTVAVNGYIEESKAKTYEGYKADLAGASENLLIDCMTNNEEGCSLPALGNDVRLSYNELVSKGYSKKLKDPEGDGYCDKSYVIAKNTGSGDMNIEYQVCLYCKNYKSEEAGCEEIHTDDTVPPTCGPSKGESEEWSKDNRVITVGCSDTNSGCVRKEYSQSIGREGEVIRESYITISDEAGNRRACPVNAYVDKKAPTCKIEVDEESVSGWYGVGVTAKITSIEDDGSSEDDPNSIEYGMGTSLLNRDYNGKTSYQVTGGIVTVFGYVKDKVGNEGYCSKEIKVDNTNPNGIIYMGYEVYPKENTTIQQKNMTITNLSKYGKIEGLIVYFSEELAENSDVGILNEVGTSIKKSGALLKGQNKVILKITAGSYEKITLNMLEKYYEELEKVEVIKKENETSVWTNKDVTVYVEANDTITGVGDYSYDNGTTYTSSNTKKYNNNAEGRVIVRDKVGNISGENFFVINKIDKDAPVITNLYNPYENTWYNLAQKTSDGASSSYKLKITATDPTPYSSGIETYSYKYETSVEDYKEYAYCKGENTCTTTAFTKERQEKVKIRVCDNVGNCSEEETNILIDVTVPTFTLNNPYLDKWCGKEAAEAGEYVLTLTDGYDEISGIQDYSWKYADKEYKIYSGSENLANHINFDTTPFTEERDENVYIRLRDKAGNETEEHTKIQIDKTAPTFRISNPYSGKWCGKEAADAGKYVLTLTDGYDEMSGIQDYSWKYADTEYKIYSGSENLANSTKFYTTAFVAERDENVYIRLRDKAGNETEKYTKIRIDRTAPSVPTSTVRYDSSNGTIRGNSNAWTKRTLWWGNYSATDDGGSEINRYEYSSNCSTNATKLGTSYTYSTDTNYSFCIRAVDNAENTSVWSERYYFKVDKTAPSLTIKNPTDGDWTNKSFSLTLEGNDGSGSGIKYYAYRYASTSYADGIYSDSAKTIFTTTAFSAQRNEYAYIQVCDNVGNCKEDSTMIKIDTTKPRAQNFKNNTMINTYSQSDLSGNSLGLTTKNFSCSSSTNKCSITVCLVNSNGFEIEVNSLVTGKGIDDQGPIVNGYSTNSGIASATQTSYQFLDKNGSNVSGICPYGKSPCKQTIGYSLIDNAGNTSSLTEEYTFGYKGSGDGSGC